MSNSSKPEHADHLEKWARKGEEGLPPVLAATVILLRDAADGSDGVEALMLRRNSKIVFGGMWVFPGGRVDPGDWTGVAEGDDLAASKRAAERESMEECALPVNPEAMHPFSHWTPPSVTPKRFLTWFFLARAESGVVKIDDGEIKESAWLSPQEALRRQAARDIELAPPTFVTLTELSKFATVDAALDQTARVTPERFQTRIGVTDEGPVAMWHGDAGYSETDPAADGALHRLKMVKGGSWQYLRTTR